MIRIVVGSATSHPISLSPEELIVLAGTPALFGEETYTFSNMFTGERGEEFLGIVGALQRSPHIFIVEEEKILKKVSDALAEQGIKIEVKKTEKKEYTFDPFGLTSALGSRDKKKLWLSLMQALRAGEKPEAIAGLLAWKARQMGDRKLSREIVFLYHDAHRGMGDLALLLERFALKL